MFGTYKTNAQERAAVAFFRRLTTMDRDTLNGVVRYLSVIQPDEYLANRVMAFCIWFIHHSSIYDGTQVQKDARRIMKGMPKDIPMKYR